MIEPILLPCPWIKQLSDETACASAHEQGPRPPDGEELLARAPLEKATRAAESPQSDIAAAEPSQKRRWYFLYLK